MKLLYCFPEPLPMSRARGIQVAHTIAELAQLGLPVTLVHAPGEGDPVGTPFSACGLTQPSNVSTHCLSRHLPWPLSRVQSNKVFFHRLRPQLSALPPDTVIMVRHIKLAAMILRGWPQAPLLYEAHEVFADTAAPGKQARVAADEALVMTHARAVVTNSGATAARLKALYPAMRCPVEVIPNGVDLPPLPRPDPRDWSAPQQHLIYAGSFFGWKGVADLLTAAAELPGHALRLLGGTSEQAARLQAEAPPPQARLDFLGRLPHAEVMQALTQSCIAILPNRPDTDSQFTSPIKLFEYMGAGCAVVASDLPSIREILADDEAAWFTPGDAADLARAIRQLAADPARAQAMGARLREKACQYTWQARAQCLHTLLSGIHDGS